MNVVELKKIWGRFGRQISNIGARPHTNQSRALDNVSPQMKAVGLSGDSVAQKRASLRKLAYDVKPNRLSLALMLGASSMESLFL
jgi:hypothetical protein